MVQNNKSKNTTTSGGLDITSWIIAIIATLLIIGGVYLLVISLNPSSKPTTIIKSASSQVNTSAALSSVASVTSAASSATSEVSSQAVINSSSVASVVVSSASVSSVAPVAPTGPAPLKTGQTNAELIGRVDGIAAGLIKITVTESGFTNTRWLRQGVFTNILASYIPNAQVGESYRISFDIGSSQADGSFVINDLKVVDKVK